MGCARSGSAPVCRAMLRGKRVHARRGVGDRCVCALACAAPASAAELIQDSFKNSTVNNPNYLVGGSAWTPCLTASQLLNQVPIPGCPLGQPSLPADGDPDGDGALRLTSNNGFSSGFILYQDALPLTAGLDIRFSFFAYNGTGADGFSFFVADGAQNLTQAGRRRRQPRLRPAQRHPGPARRLLRRRHRRVRQLLQRHREPRQRLHDAGARRAPARPCGAARPRERHHRLLPARDDERRRGRQPRQAGRHRPRRRRPARRPDHRRPALAGQRPGHRLPEDSRRRRTTPRCSAQPLPPTRRRRSSSASAPRPAAARTSTRSARWSSTASTRCRGSSSRSRNNGPFVTGGSGTFTLTARTETGTGVGPVQLAGHRHRHLPRGHDHRDPERHRLGLRRHRGRLVDAELHAAGEREPDPAGTTLPPISVPVAWDDADLGQVRQRRRGRLARQREHARAEPGARPVRRPAARRRRQRDDARRPAGLAAAARERPRLARPDDGPGAQAGARLRVLEPGDGRLLYIPHPGYSGHRHFTYTVRDTSGQRLRQNITITVTPLARDDARTTPFETPVRIPVLRNDSGSLIPRP